MPSFDTVLEPNLVELRNAVEQTNKEIGTRFDFKGSSAKVEITEKSAKERELSLFGDSDFQLEQVRDVLLGKLAKRGVDIRFLDLSAKPVKLGGDKLKHPVAVKAGIMIQLTFLPDWVAFVLTMVWLVGMTNAVNLIDVSDGLAAGVSSVAGMFLYIVALRSGSDTIATLTLALVGATLGFLAYNRPPARIYMGDTGSMLLGFVLGALAMIGHYTFVHRVAAVAPIVILGVPIFDTAYVMGVRAWRRIPLMRGSPDHFAVRLRNHGFAAGRIALIGYTSGLLLGGIGLALCWVSFEVAVALLGFVGVLALAATLTLWKMGRAPQAGKTGG